MKPKQKPKEIEIQNDLDYVYVKLLKSNETYYEISLNTGVSEIFLKKFAKNYENGKDFSFRIINKLTNYFKRRK